MEGKIDCTFTTTQRDFFVSGMAATIGMNAFGVWTAIKVHADFNTGVAWPGLRRIADLTGLNKDTVARAIKVLVAEKLLRLKPRGRGFEYIARERLVIRLGDRVLCTVVVDYIPATLRKKLKRMKQSLTAGEHDPESFAEAEIIPGPGFQWDATTSVLRAQISPSDIRPDDLSDKQLQSAIVQRIQNIRKKSTGVDNSGLTE